MSDMYWLWFYDLGFIFIVPKEACHENVYEWGNFCIIELGSHVSSVLLVIVVYVSNGIVAMDTFCQCYCASHCIVLTICSLQLSAQVMSFSF